MSSFQYVECSTRDEPPANALQGGYDNGPSFHARGVVSGKTIPGKVGVDSNGRLVGACIPYGTRENWIHSFEVLTSTPELKISYVRCKTGDKPPKNSVQGGYDNGPSYHARGLVDGKRIPGKVGVKDWHLKGACIAYGGKENRINDFEVLVKVIDDSIGTRIATITPPLPTTTTEGKPQVQTEIQPPPAHLKNDKPGSNKTPGKRKEQPTKGQSGGKRKKLNKELLGEDEEQE